MSEHYLGGPSERAAASLVGGSRPDEQIKPSSGLDAVAQVHHAPAGAALVEQLEVDPDIAW